MEQAYSIENQNGVARAGLIFVVITWTSNIFTLHIGVVDRTDKKSDRNQRRLKP